MVDSSAAIDAGQWNALLATQSDATPFMRHEYLAALEASGSAVAATGWHPQFVLLEKAHRLVGACALYLKNHSHGEYVFDWSWANAYAQHGLPYYPKAVIAVPFTPVPGSRLLARSSADRAQVAAGLVQWCKSRQLSSLHVLFTSPQDQEACVQAGMMLRHTVQFHWNNSAPGYGDFEAFLGSLAQDKRKKIRQERRKVAEAGVSFRWAQGTDISAADWEFFYRCYERTYLEHGNAPYLNRQFFGDMATTMPENWLLFIAERNGQPIATSLIAINPIGTRARAEFHPQSPGAVAYGRYWGALERVDCLHFEACYYQPLQWCIENGYQRFEGGAQGEHKLARALLPVMATSAHWLAHPAFADAVEKFLSREGEGVSDYLDELRQRSPMRKTDS
ncbi:MAG: GNAT family N-acetyltransferase [Burkholderiales bacterium]|nr:GNAT family N-acetyltransferase [Burkholderiales bacterium]